MNLLVEKCDCTITATYKDAEGKQYGVNVLTADGKGTYSQQFVAENSSVDVTAPAPRQLIQYLTIGKLMTKVLLRILTQIQPR